MWGITVLIIGAITLMHPAPAIVVTPPGGKAPNRAEAEEHISHALTTSSLAPVQDRACALELVEPFPVRFYLNCVTGPCGSSLTMALRRIVPRLLKSNVAKTPTFTPSIGSWV